MSRSWFRTGHWTNSQDLTGCTAIIFDQQSPAAVDVRGGAPGTRETTLLGVGQRGAVDAIVLSGGSAFGLASVDGVLSVLASQGRGLPTPAGPVPLVPGAIIYDLAVGSPTVPDAASGREAALSAATANFESGALGAGTGATVAKLGGLGSPSGIGWGFVDAPTGDVTAAVVVNAVGDVVRPSDGKILVGASDPDGLCRSGTELLLQRAGRARRAENTTIGCVMVDVALDRYALSRAVIAAHDGLARTISPAHTPFDGDTFFVVARECGNPEFQDVASLCVGVTIAVENAVMSLFENQHT